GMLGMLLLACHDLERLLTTADIAAAMSVEALLGTDRVFAADLQELRPHPGQARSAANMRALLAGSPIVASHRGPDCTRVQDAYSLRCAPQVAGAARDTAAHARAVAERELAAAIDNPVVLADGRVESNGNFHGAPIGYVLDFLAIAVADVASISERRTDRFLDVARTHGLPAFLADDPGVDSGHMIAQYTQAALVSELKRLAVPASVDSIPSSAMQEDHVSMGWSAARKLRRAIDGLTRVLAVEILTAARGIDLRTPHRPAPATGAVVAALRREVPGPGPDRYLAPEIEAAVRMVRDGSLIAAAEQVTGPLASTGPPRGPRARPPAAGTRSAGDDGGQLHLQQQAGLEQPAHLHRGAGRGHLGDVALPHPRVLQQQVHVGEEGPDEGDVAEGAPLVGEDEPQILEDHLRLPHDVPFADHLAVGVHRHLAGDEQRVPRPHRVRVAAVGRNHRRRVEPQRVLRPRLFRQPSRPRGRPPRPGPYGRHDRRQILLAQTVLHRARQPPARR